MANEGAPEQVVVAVPGDNEVASRLAALRSRLGDGRMELLGGSSPYEVEVVEADPSWPQRYDAVRSRLAAALAGVALRIEHVGSTSVPGLAAKPIIDVQVSVGDVTNEVTYAPSIAALGWPLRLREADHRYFREPHGVARTTHIHVCSRGGEWERRHLLFRDYLRAHPDRAAAYAAMKAAVAERYRRDGLAYTEAKGPFIEHTTALAEAWAASTGWEA